MSEAELVKKKSLELKSLLALDFKWLYVTRKRHHLNDLEKNHKRLTFGQVWIISSCIYPYPTPPSTLIFFPWIPKSLADSAFAWV